MLLQRANGTYRWTDRLRQDRWTLYQYKDPAPHTMRAMPLTINWVQCAVVGSCEAGKQCIISHRRREEGATVEQKWRASGQCRVTVGYQHRRLTAAIRYSSRHHWEWTALGWRVCKHFLIRSCRDAATTATAAVSVAPLRTTYCSHCSHRSAWPSCPACWNRQMTVKLLTNL